MPETGAHMKNTEAVTVMEWFGRYPLSPGCQSYPPGPQSPPDQHVWMTSAGQQFHVVRFTPQALIGKGRTNPIHRKDVEDIAPLYFQWGDRDMGDDAGMVDDNRRLKHSFWQKASGKTESPIRSVGVCKPWSKGFIWSNAKIEGWLATLYFIFPYTGTWMDKNVGDLAWF